MTEQKLVGVLEAEVSILRGKHMKLTKKQREKMDGTFGIAWLAIWEGQIESYERILKDLKAYD